MSIRIWFAALLVLLFTSVGLCQDQNPVLTQNPDLSQTPQTTGVVTKIEVHGNEHVTTDAILARMRTKVGQPYNQAQLDQDRDSIQALGFFRAVSVHPTLISGTNWDVIVDVDEFAVVKEIRVAGNTVIPTDQILKVSTIVVGQPFNLNDAEPTSAAIAKLYSNKGYFGVVSDLEPLTDSPSTVNIQVQEMKVNSVGVEGNARTKNWVMRRLIRTKPGDAYNIRKWDDDLKRIFGTRWFDKVDPDDHVTPDGNAIDLLAVVKEARTGAATVGVSLAPSTGLAGDASLRDTNFNGTGQSIGISFMQAITGGGPSVSLNYGDPFIDNNLTALNVSLYSQLEYLFTGSGFGQIASTSSSLYTIRRTGLSLSLSRPVGSQLTAEVGGKAENVRTADVTNVVNSAFIQQDGDVATGSLGLNRDRRDIGLDPSRGDWTNLLVEPGVSHINEIGGAVLTPVILGWHTFDRNTIEYRAYFTNQPPRGRNYDAPRRVVAFRLRYGFITGVPPFFEQFFIGGADTLRGYDDDRFWGTQELLSSLEYRYPIQKSFDLIPFVDYGGAWGGYGGVNTFTQSSNMLLHLAYGVGVGLRIPSLGQIRIDLGFNDRGGNRITFLIGPNF